MFFVVVCFHVEADVIISSSLDFCGEARRNQRKSRITCEGRMRKNLNRQASGGASDIFANVWRTQTLDLTVDWSCVGLGRGNERWVHR